MRLDTGMINGGQCLNLDMERPPTEAALFVRGAVRSTLCATEDDAMHLAFFGVQQNGAAMAACVVNRVVAGLQYWGAFTTRPMAGAVTNLRLILRSGMGVLPCTGGSTKLSATDAWAQGRCR